jgi:hypothetical protein
MGKQDPARLREWGLLCFFAHIGPGTSENGASRHAAFRAAPEPVKMLAPYQLRSSSHGLFRAVHFSRGKWYQFCYSSPLSRSRGSENGVSRHTALRAAPEPMKVLAPQQLRSGPPGLFRAVHFSRREWCEFCHSSPLSRSRAPRPCHHRRVAKSDTAREKNSRRSTEGALRQSGESRVENAPS